MDFKDQVKALAERVVKMKDQVNTEEATKNAFIMPFMQTLGYDVFNPMEVVPEYTADVGTKKGEKVDYAIMRDAIPAILIECKHWREKLEAHNNQIVRYFTVSKAKFAILTNGIRYRFYTDLVETNMMDEKPFLDIDFTDLREPQIEELKKFHKSYFDVTNIVSSASEMKYTNEIKNLLQTELKTPSADFIRFIVGKVYTGVKTEKVIFQFSEFVKKSVHNVVGDMITERLKNALTNEETLQLQAVEVPPTTSVAELPTVETGKEIVTTAEELEGFYIVKSILRSKVESNRITHRDTLSYFNVILDDNIRRTICRLYFNNSKKQLGYFDESKKETKVELKSLDDIYQYADALCATAETYLNLKG
jgi:predicted type IV restriction endonuclease